MVSANTRLVRIFLVALSCFLCSFPVSADELSSEAKLKIFKKRIRLNDVQQQQVRAVSEQARAQEHALERAFEENLEALKAKEWEQIWVLLNPAQQTRFEEIIQGKKPKVERKKTQSADEDVNENWEREFNRRRVNNLTTL